MQDREYTESEITVERKIFSSKNFSSYVISYLSDGLKLYALMNVPNTKKPENGFPVVIINHGFIEPKDYNTINSYKSITDYFSEKGYLVLKPDYRGNGVSETQDSTLMRFAYPVDVLNLIESLKNIPQANSNQIYLYGHSMGGEIVLKVLEIAGKKPETLAKIKAAVLWAPVTNLSDWFSKSHVPWLQETKNNKNYYLETFKIMKTPEENPILWQSVSPINYLSDIQTPIQINHGVSDGTVAYHSSIELYDNLISLNKTAELLIYPDNDHNLVRSWSKAAANSLSFFKRY
ncbi:MAG: alpha/beta fold hydrolase [Patescibacteria group bacterium]|nr:alpha/beta fold hydrolase [Patescibacteria group bacterium]